MVRVFYRNLIPTFGILLQKKSMTKFEWEIEMKNKKI